MRKLWPAKGDVLIGPNVLIAPSPALAILLETNPEQIELCPVIYQYMGQRTALGRDEGQRWVKLLDHSNTTLNFSLRPVGLLIFARSSQN